MTDWSQVEREHPSCPICSHEQHKLVFTTEKFVDFNLVRCLKCGFHYLNPRPTEEALLELYARDDYFEGDHGGGYASYTAQAEALQLTFKALMQQLAKRGMTGDSLLEVGCGYGFLLKEAQLHFQTIHATDFSAGALAKAETYATTAFQGGLDALPPNASYQTILANHVIEHVHDPHQFVRDCVSRLKPKGTLLLSTPDAGSFWFKLMGKRWPSYIVPDHLLYFTESHLRQLLSQAGLNDLHTIPYPHAFPLSLIAQKLGLRVPKSLGKFSLWLPKTTVAVAGRRVR
jgi:SAM-dependent methyltransferase